MKDPAWLSIQAVLAFHEELVAEHGGPSLLRDRGLLESALASPRNHFAYGEHDLFVLATVSANCITRKHPFGDGNKRAAFIAAYTFLGINGLELQAPEAEVVQAVEGLSARRMSEGEFTAWLRRSCILHPDEKSTRRAAPRKNAPRNRRRHP